MRVLEGGEGVESAGNEDRSSSRSNFAAFECGVEVAEAGGELGGAAMTPEEAFYCFCSH